MSPPTEVLDRYYLLLTFLVTAAFQFLCFLLAFLFKTDKITDFSGVTNHFILPRLTLLLSHTTHSRNIVTSSLYILWALRLGIFLLYRILLTGRDTRFDAFRNRLLPLLGFWTLQALWVFLCALPTTLLNSPATVTRPQPRFGTGADIAGVILFALGLVIETVADLQRLWWRRGGGVGVLRKGLWAWSRHPNYFGEMVLQWGVFVMAVSAQREVWAGVVGPVATMALLLGVSGVPVGERGSGEKWWKAGGERWEDWVAYTQGTSVVVPMPGWMWRGLPGWVRSSVGCEWAWFRFVPGDEQRREEGRAGAE